MVMPKPLGHHPIVVPRRKYERDGPALQFLRQGENFATLNVHIKYSKINNLFGGRPLRRVQAGAGPHHGPAKSDNCATHLVRDQVLVLYDQDMFVGQGS
jgi:hypothetical protein